MVLQFPEKLRFCSCFEGTRLQARRKARKINAALAAEGIDGNENDFFRTLFSHT
jgi:hypothetical protein